MAVSPLWKHIQTKNLIQCTKQIIIKWTHDPSRMTVLSLRTRKNCQQTLVEIETTWFRKSYRILQFDWSGIRFYRPKETSMDTLMHDTLYIKQTGSQMQASIQYKVFTHHNQFYWILFFLWPLWICFEQDRTYKLPKFAKVLCHETQLLVHLRKRRKGWSSSVMLPCVCRKPCSFL